MYDLTVDENYILDMHDDFIMNYNEDLYEFIGSDITDAYWLGYNIKTWFEELDKDQKYLHSKHIRHNSDILEQYNEQFKYWTNKLNQNDEIGMIEFAEYILENMILYEDKHIIHLAFWLGQFSKNNLTEKIILQLDKNNKVIKEWDSIDAITEEFDKNAIKKCCEGQQGSHRGYIWKYKDD